MYVCDCRFIRLRCCWKKNLQHGSQTAKAKIWYCVAKANQPTCLISDFFSTTKCKQQVKTVPLSQARKTLDAKRRTGSNFAHQVLPRASSCELLIFSSSSFTIFWWIQHRMIDRFVDWVTVFMQTSAQGRVENVLVVKIRFSGVSMRTYDYVALHEGKSNLEQL